MATLTDVRGDWISLEILDYEFPAHQPEHEHDYDANWLMIRLGARLRGQEWTAVSPALLTWEMDALAQLVERLAVGSAIRGEDWLNMEPNIWLRIRSSRPEHRRVGLHLTDTFRPPNKPHFGQASYVLSVTPGVLGAFAAELRAEALRFPVRTKTSEAAE